MFVYGLIIVHSYKWTLNIYDCQGLHVTTYIGFLPVLIW